MKLLRDSILAPGSEIFNFDQRKATEIELSDLQNLISTIPWSAGKRIIAVSEVDQLRLEQKHLLAELLPKIPDSSCVVLTAEKVAEAEILYKAVAKIGEIVEFSPLREDKLVSWIEEKIKGQGKSVDPQAALMLAQAIGDDLGMLGMEINKLVTYAGERPGIEKKDVEEQISANPQFKVYQLIDFIAQDDVLRSLDMSREILVSKGSVGIIMNQLVQDYFYLWRLFTFAGSRSNFSGLAEHMGLSHQVFRVNKYLTCSRNYSLAKTELALKKICATDIALRHSPISAETLVEQLVLELCALSEGRVEAKGPV